MIGSSKSPNPQLNGFLAAILDALSSSRWMSTIYKGYAPWVMKPTPREFALEKGLAITPVAAGCLLLPIEDFMVIGIILGQGHFLLSYIYKIKSGRLDLKSVMIWALVAAFMFYAFSAPERYTPLLLITSIYLVTHVVMDDRHLVAPTYSWRFTLEIMAILFLYYALIIDSIYLSEYTTFGVMGVTGLLAFYFVQCAREKKWPDCYSCFFLAHILFLVILFAVKDHIRTGWINAGAGIYHYMVWYVAYYRKVKPSEEKTRTYLGWSSLVNASVASLYIYYIMMPEFSYPLHYFFDMHFFLIWAFLHFFSATRMTDLEHLKSIKLNTTSTSNSAHQT